MKTAVQINKPSNNVNTFLS